MRVWMYNNSWNFNIYFYYVCWCRWSGPLIESIYVQWIMLWWVSSACWIPDIQTVQTLRLWYWTEKICVRGQQCTWHWTSYKHFDITRQKNVGGEGWRAWGGGVAGKPWPELDFNKKFMCRSARDGRFRRRSQPGGRGLMHAPPLPLPLDGSLVVRPKRAQKLLAGSPDTPPFAARASAPPALN
jgi:hypothetical protein